MSTFYGSPGHMMRSVGDLVGLVDETADVHTITFVLNGQHGEFDVTILATDEDGEDVTYTAIAHRTGYISDFARKGE